MTCKKGESQYFKFWPLYNSGFSVPDIFFLVSVAQVGLTYKVNLFIDIFNRRELRESFTVKHKYVDIFAVKSLIVKFVAKQFISNLVNLVYLGIQMF